MLCDLFTGYLAVIVEDVKIMYPVGRLINGSHSFRNPRALVGRHAGNEIDLLSSFTFRYALRLGAICTHTFSKRALDVYE